MVVPRLRIWFDTFRFTVTWNVLLLLAGSFLVAVAVKAVAVPHGLLTGGMSGLGLLFYYIFPQLEPGSWYFLLNVPVFVLGWVAVSRRFFFYSLFGMVACSGFIELVTFTLPIRDVWLAVFVGGGLLGAGVGLTLRSLGSTGGSDILAVLLNKKIGLSIGAFEFWFNLIVFLAGFYWLDLDVMLYSIVMTFVIAMVIEHTLNMFRERIMVIVVTDHPHLLLKEIMDTLDRGATILHGQGAYSGKDKEVVLTMVNNIQLKRLEEMIHTIDPKAFTIMGQGFHVVGEGFSKRKVY